MEWIANFSAEHRPRDRRRIAAPRRTVLVGVFLSVFAGFSGPSTGSPVPESSLPKATVQPASVSAFPAPATQTSSAVTPSPSPPAATAPGDPKANTPLPAAVSAEEDKLGKEGVKEVEAEYDIVKDPVLLAKLQDMVTSLEKGTPYPDLHYTVNIVKAKHPAPDPEINAFSLPGGYIFVTKDLLDTVQSDDETAAVLAHEMAHVVHHHVIRQIKARNHDEMMSIIPIILDLLVHGFKPNTDTPNVAVMSQQVVQALQSPHSIHDETEADLSGIDYMYKTGRYDPVGMMTFMQRLARTEERHVDIDPGYLQTHPSSIHRVDDIRDRLKLLEVPINTRKVTRALTAEAAPGPGAGSVTVRMRKLDICTFVGSLDGAAPEQRAAAAVKAINKSLDEGHGIAELDIHPDNGSATVVWGTRRLFTITDEDAQALKETDRVAAANAVDQIRKALWADGIDNS